MQGRAGSFGIYVHVPWCRTRCPYCAFNVYPDREASWEPWAEGVLAEWALRAPAFLRSPEDRAHSVYFGGGTPSLAPPALIARLVSALPRAEEAEITLEANPGRLRPEDLAAWREAGINRVSVGIQTFDARFAHLLNRGHTVAQARELGRMVAEARFRSWSLDLIFALPGQTVEDLREDLRAVLELAPPHVSLYGLTFEPGTPFGRAAEQGRLSPPEPELWRAQYDLVVDTLAAGGWERYEVSNFARPGHRAVHNEAVWRGGYYAGLGPGAHGFEPDGHRTVNRASPERWREDPTETRERGSAEEAAVDLVLSTLRHRDGLDLALLARRAAHRVREAALRPLLAPPPGGAPLLERHEGHLRLTGEGFPLADGVVSRVIGALEPAPGA